MFRTPKKAANATFDKPPYISSPSDDEFSAAGTAYENHVNRVRRSIGEWENNNPDRKIPAPPPRPSLDKASPEKQAVDSVQPKEYQKKTKCYANRLAEARVCLTKAKTSLGQSRNTKTDIKNEVLLNLDRLFVLLKESEAEKGRSTLPSSSTSRQPSTSQDDKHLIIKIDAQTTLLKEHSARLEELKHAFDAQKAADTAAQQSLSGLAKEMRELRRTSDPAASTAVTCSVSHDLGEIVSEMKELRRIGEETERRVAHLQQTPSYAEVVTGPVPRSPALIQPTHSLIVSSGEEDTSEDVLSKVRVALDAKTSGFQIHRVRKVKNQKVVLSCGSKEEMSRMAAKLKTTGSLNVEEAKNKNPLVILKDLLTYNTDADIIASLKAQNKQLMGDLSADDFEATTVRYRRRARNPHENHVVLQVSPRMWQKLTSAGRVHIDMQYVAVEDQSPLVQCTKCLGYGHGRKLCREPVDLCSYCSGPHLRMDCPRSITGDIPSCRNCKASKYPDANHNAFSGDCPIRKKWDAIARSSVAYC